MNNTYKKQYLKYKSKYLRLKGGLVENNYNDLYSKLDKKRVVKIDGYDIYIHPKFSKNFNEHYVMAQIGFRDFDNKIRKIIKDKYSELSDGLDKDTYGKIVDVFMKCFKQMHLTIWKNPFVDNEGTYHVVSGTRYDKHCSNIVGNYKNWLRIDKAEVTNIKDDKFLPNTNPIEGIDFEKYKKVIYQIYFYIVKLYEDLFLKLIKAI